MAEAYLGVGSNLDPARHLLAALGRLVAVERVTAVSTVYRSAALDRPTQPEYRNAVWRLETGRSATQLRHLLRGIEDELGRVRQADRYAARPIDLDLLLHGDAREVDPDLRHRSFVAVPLLELAPDLVLPDTGERLAELAVAHDDALVADVALTAACRERIPA